MGKRVKIWSRVERVVALCVGLGIVLAGCAVQKPETGNRKPEVNKVEIPNPENFTTLGKLTKTVWTPWGEKQIYDPAQDAEFIDAFSIYRNSGYSFDEWQIFSKRDRLDFGRRVVLDYGRAGCKIMTDSRCSNHSVDYFGKNCGDAHNFTKLELSECEKDNYRTLLPPGAVLIEQCELNSQVHRSQAYKAAPNLASSIKIYTETECKVWNKGFFKGE